MTKQIFKFSVLICGLFFMASCDKDSLQDFDADTQLIQEIQNANDRVTIDANDLPANVQVNADENYFETFIETAVQAPQKGFEIKMEDGSIAYFRTTGEELQARRKGKGKKGGDYIKPADLPEGVLAYITSNYPDAKVKGGKERDGSLYVGLADKRILVFDADGNFIEETTIEDHTCGGKDKGVKIAFEDLPQVTQDYITSNYPDAEVKKAKHLEGVKYVVGLLEGEAKVLVVFDADGNFEFERRKE